jgi:capsule polysaccharide export protein KpsE/RkpR
MKNKPLLITVLAAFVFAAGCGKEPTAAQQIETIKTETKEAKLDMKDYTYAQKAEFVTYMQGQLTTLDADLDKLAAKIEKSSDAVKADAKPKLEALRKQAANLKQQLADSQNATETTWESVKTASKKTWESLATSFAEARQWASDKIAP